jgi:hypothetical protein
VSQPATGQIDGVAAASACRRSTLSRTESRREPDGAEQIAEHAEHGVRRAEAALEHGRQRVAAHGRAPIARDLTTAGSLSIARLAVGSTAARSPISSTADCSAEI